MTKLAYNPENKASWTLKTGETTITQNRFAVLDTSNAEQCQNGTSGAGNVIGVLADSSHVAGRVATYQYSGIAQVEAAGVIAAGATIMCGDTSGRAATWDGTATADRCGRALSAAAATGDIILVMLSLPNPQTS